ncbi:Zinc-finger of C2H2 type [Novymonas esmeraldas]|uniref:Zinc-finger of C2H2 type n=1 Tax=Novymonas esmeraldas TaxID=1808958 RepID=A0AAW0EWH7_9TRYP
MAARDGGGLNALDPVEVARSNPYFKRNHMGHVTCTLCGIYCTEENNFLKHIAGKTHATQLERRQHKELHHLRLQEEERRNAEAEERARREEALLALGGRTGTSGGGAAAAAGASAAAAAAVDNRFGAPLYTFRTEHDEVAYRTKVWVEVMFTAAEDGTRPLHRWLSAREQLVERPPDDYFVYLLVACEGYATIALKFPAKATRSQPRDVLEEADGSTSDAYACSWDPLRRLYTLFFVLSR